MTQIDGRPQGTEAASGLPEGSLSPQDQAADVTESPASAFGRSRRAIRELMCALRHDLRALLRRGVSRMRTGIQNIRERHAKGRGHTLNERLRDIPATFAALSRNAMTSMAIIRTRMAGKTQINPLKLRSRRVLFALVPCCCFLVVAGVLTWALKDVPWQEIADGSLKPIIVLETADGGPLVRQGPYQELYAGYDQFPPHLIDAVLSIEDRRFMDHYGVDLKGITRALLRNFEAGSVVQGGSTITQQLIKLQYLESDRTLKRKIQEVVIAFWLEWKLGKQEILTRYLNAVYLGSGATGMPAAARIYFNKDVGALDIPESAMLAGLLKAPSQLNPIDNFEGARQRTATVLDAMVANGKLTPEEACCQG